MPHLQGYILNMFNNMYYSAPKPTYDHTLFGFKW